MARLRRARTRPDDAVWDIAVRLLDDRDLRHRHPQHRSSVAVAAGSHVHVLRLRDLHRRRGRHAPQRSPVSDGGFRSDARHAAAGDRDRHSRRGSRCRAVSGLFRLHQFPSRLRQLPHALDDADCFPLRGDPDFRSADRAVHRRAARQRHPQRLRPPRAARRAGAHHADRPDCEGGALVSAPLILALMTVLFLVFGYMGVPVAFSLMAGVLVGAMFTDVSMPAIIQKMFDGVDNEALLAIPFFLLVGELMSSANVVMRVANLALALVGHIRGGLSQVVTVFSMMFSEMSGSTTADVAVISRALGGPMKRESYDPPFIPAIIAAASTIAALVPPSITAVVYFAVGNVSIAGLFMAGVVPGLMIGFGLMIYCYFFGPPGTRKPRASMRQVMFATGDAALPLMIPVILLGGILTGWFTPTEAGVVAVIWIIAVVIPALNRGHFRKIPYDFCLAGLIFSLPLITIGAANAFGWMLAYLRGAIVIADWITSIAGNDPQYMMLLLVLLFTVIGDFIEPVPTIIIFMPLVNTLTQAGDINGVHMGVVLIATLAFGLITPPYGLVLLMASKFVGVSFGKALRAALPIYVVFLVTIAFAIYFPKAVLWLPKQVNPASVGCFKNPSGPGYIWPP